MRNKFLILFVLALGTISSASVLSSSARFAHGVGAALYGDAKFAAKAVSFPVRHPKKSARGVAKSAKASASAVYKKL